MSSGNIKVVLVVVGSSGKNEIIELTNLVKIKSSEYNPDEMILHSAPGPMDPRGEMNIATGFNIMETDKDHIYTLHYDGCTPKFHKEWIVRGFSEWNGLILPTSKINLNIMQGNDLVEILELPKISELEIVDGKMKIPQNDYGLLSINFFAYPQKNTKLYRLDEINIDTSKSDMFYVDKTPRPLHMPRF